MRRSTLADRNSASADERGAISAMHALFMLRWLGQSPEAFLGYEGELPAACTIPDPGPDRRLTGLRTAKFGLNMRIAMAITQWLHRPAAEFIYAAEW